MNTQAATQESKEFVAAKLPIDRELIKSRRLLDMIELVEVCRAPDGQRTVWQMLVDAGAEIDHIVYRDVEDDRSGVRLPALQFRINTSKMTGFLILEDDPAERAFRILAQDEKVNGSIAKTVVERVFTNTLAARLASLIDDGTRRWNEEVGRLIIKQ